MYMINTYEEIEKNEKMLNEKHIIVLLFVRPSLSGAKEIIEEFEYLHHNSGKYCSIYAVGYSDSNTTAHESFTDIRSCGNISSSLNFSNQAFIDFKNKLEKRLNWNYSGEIELIILQSNPNGRSVLNFSNYLCIDINDGIKKGYVDSFPRFMESLIRNSRQEIEVKRLSNSMQKSRYNIKWILETSIDECKSVPSSIRKIVKDRLFYRTSRSYS